MATDAVTASNPPQAELTLLWLGTYESDYPRTRVLHTGLRDLGVRVVECHRPVWELTRHKAGDFLSVRRAPGTVWRFGSAWAAIAAAQRRAGTVDAVVAGYPAQLDAPLAWLAARARRVPLVIDALISLSDTLGGDRARARSLATRALGALDSAALRVGSLVLADTHAHSAYFAQRFGVAPSRIAVVPVGAEADKFPEAPPPASANRVLFYGKLAPLHGLETVLEAARRPGVPPVRVIGEGQLGGWLREELRRSHPRDLEHLPWVPYESLGAELAAAAICLGIFGTSEKARRVVPNKIFQAMAVGRPIVTADTPAVRELLEHDRDALLVPAGDPNALAAALTRLAGDQELRRRLGEAARRRYEEVATPAAVARRFLSALTPRLVAR
jgi:glycosyltransferase involved in cell wall biosynthesis